MTGMHYTGAYCGILVDDDDDEDQWQDCWYSVACDCVKYKKTRPIVIGNNHPWRCIRTPECIKATRAQDEAAGLRISDDGAIEPQTIWERLLRIED